MLEWIWKFWRFRNSKKNPETKFRIPIFKWDLDKRTAISKVLWRDFGEKTIPTLFCFNCQITISIVHDRFVKTIGICNFFLHYPPLISISSDYYESYLGIVTFLNPEYIPFNWDNKIRPSTYDLLKNKL